MIQGIGKHNVAQKKTGNENQTTQKIATVIKILHKAKIQKLPLVLLKLSNKMIKTVITIILRLQTEMK